MQLTKKGNNPVIAIGYFFKGLALLTKPELRSFVLIPLVINFLLYSLALTVGYHYMH